MDFAAGWIFAPTEQQIALLFGGTNLYCVDDALWKRFSLTQCEFQYVLSFSEHEAYRAFSKGSAVIYFPRSFLSGDKPTPEPTTFFFSFYLLSLLCLYTARGRRREGIAVSDTRGQGCLRPSQPSGLKWPT